MHRKNLKWLSVQSLVKYRSLCAMNQIYVGQNTLLDPSISFGKQHDYNTRYSPRFALPVLCHLASTKTLFRHSAAQWWSNLPDDILLTLNFRPLFLASC